MSSDSDTCLYSEACMLRGMHLAGPSPRPYHL